VFLNFPNVHTWMFARLIDMDDRIVMLATEEARMPGVIDRHSAHNLRCAVCGELGVRWSSGDPLHLIAELVDWEWIARALRERDRIFQVTTPM
jgi:hypothetical protein